MIWILISIGIVVLWSVLCLGWLRVARYRNRARSGEVPAEKTEPKALEASNAPEKFTV